MSLSRALPGDSPETPLLVDARGHLVQTGKLFLSEITSLSDFGPQNNNSPPRTSPNLDNPTAWPQILATQTPESRAREALSFAYIQELEACAQSLLQQARMEQHRKARAARGAAELARHTSKIVDSRKRACALQARVVTQPRAGIRIRVRSGARMREGPALSKEDLYLTSERPPTWPSTKRRPSMSAGFASISSRTL
ncbi:hypothetical protein B0H13DRAFT_2355301 [Mycena leptocephala]|nr:hypothetical protein B0H13DRAFT_2355301 [Mycena leptocephala]